MIPVWCKQLITGCYSIYMYIYCTCCTLHERNINEHKVQYLIRISPRKQHGTFSDTIASDMACNHVASRNIISWQISVGCVTRLRVLDTRPSAWYCNEASPNDEYHSTLARVSTRSKGNDTRVASDEWMTIIYIFNRYDVFPRARRRIIFSHGRTLFTLSFPCHIQAGDGISIGHAIVSLHRKYHMKRQLLFSLLAYNTTVYTFFHLPLYAPTQKTLKIAQKCWISSIESNGPFQRFDSTTHLSSQEIVSTSSATRI